MFINEVHGTEAGEEKEAEKFLGEGRRKAITREIEQIVSDEFDRLEEYAGSFISDVAASRAEKFLEKVLSGDEDAAMWLLGDESGYSRYRANGLDNGKPWASLIHGRLSETNMIKLRREIVDAHAELLVSERIADLDSIVAGLEDQIRKQDAEISNLRDRL